jgi:hypothetical protein
MIHWVSTIGDCRNYMIHVVSTKYLVSPLEFLQLYMAANVETQSLSRLAVTDCVFILSRTSGVEIRPPGRGLTSINEVGSNGRGRGGHSVKSSPLFVSISLGRLSIGQDRSSVSEL